MKIYVVTFSSGSYEDYRTHIIGCSMTLQGAKIIRNNFIVLLSEYETKLNKMESDKRFDFTSDNLKLTYYNANSLDIQKYELDKLLIKLNNNGKAVAE